MTPVGEMAAWVAGLKLADAPADVVARARLQAANTHAAARAGRTAEAVQDLKRAVRKLESPGPSRVAGERYRLAAPAAAYVNAAASIAHDWDDYLLMGHTGHSAVWASRAVAELAGASEDEVTAAQIAANEIAGRIGAALVLGPHNGQFWSSIHCAGAAAAASKVLGLDDCKTAQALAISLYQPPFGLWPGFMGPDSKLLTAADPLTQGIRAAFLAAEGFTGPLDVIEHRRGLLASFAYHGLPSALTGLGETWLTETLAFKPYPGCAYLQAAVAGFLRLRGEHGFGAQDLTAIDVDAGLLTVGMEGLGRGEGKQAEITPVRVNFSVALSLAVAAHAGRLTHHELRRAWLAARAGDLRKLAGRVTVRHDWDLTFATLDGLAAGVDLRRLAADVPLRAWPGVLRRLAELEADGTVAEFGSVARLLRHPRLPHLLRDSVGRRLRAPFGGHAGSRPVVDSGAARLAFPARVTVRLTDGSSLSDAGGEPGRMGSPLAEVREVVARKESIVAAEP